MGRIAPFSREGIRVGGDLNIVNACSRTHGPSWRMVVEFGPSSVIAHGIYPGGQSGNPGSPWYDNMIGDWAEGKLQELVFLKQGQKEIPTGSKSIQINPAK